MMIARPRPNARTAARAQRSALIRAIPGENPGASPATSSNSVATGPGQSWLTTTPRARASTRSDSVNAVTKCFEPVYAANPGRIWSPSPELTLRIPPRRRATMPGRTRRVSRASATTLSWSIRSVFSHEVRS
jgi:hypothetical protein